MVSTAWDGGMGNAGYRRLSGRMYKSVIYGACPFIERPSLWGGGILRSDAVRLSVEFRSISPEWKLIETSVHMCI